MIQKVYHDFLRPIRSANLPKCFKPGLLTALLVLLVSSVTNQLFAESSSIAVADTTIKAQICDNETYAFAGHLLDTAGVYTVVYPATDGTDSTVTLILSVLPVPVTNLVAGICEGTSYLFHGDTLNVSGTYSDTLTAVNGCDSIVNLKLNVAVFFELALNAFICEGDTLFFAGLSLTESGTYVDSLSAIGGCDSTITLQLIVYPTLYSNLEASICAGNAYLFGGDLLFEEGIYADTLQSVNGCDSVSSLLLHVFPLQQTLLDVTICFGETYLLGQQPFTQSGVYSDTLVSSVGCDSIVILTLSVLPEQLLTISATICNNESYFFNGDLLGQDGVYSAVFTDVNGCDSTVTLTLTVLPIADDTINATICGNNTYPFFGEILNQSGMYTATTTASNGCDSTITLNLTVLPVPTTDLLVTLCHGETYGYFGEILTETGFYQYNFGAANSCDSLVNLTLLVLPANHTQLEAVLCYGSFYILNGDTLTTSGIYSAILTDGNGCDSTITVIVTVLPEQQSAIAATVCANEGYLFDGNLLFQSGAYSAVLTDNDGCDSIVTLTLTVLPAAAASVDATICSNENYPFYGIVLNQSGQYTATIPAVNGCDSVITLHLTVLPVSTTDLLVTLCYGAIYDYFGEILAETGLYQYTYLAANGCDSIVNLTLTVLPENTTQLTAILCAGSSYAFNGETLTTDGAYTALLEGSNGCDSTVTLSLTFIDAFETSLAATICSGQTYDYQGEPLTQSGIYTFGYTAVGGCDSVVTLTLTVLPTYNTAIAATICANESYAFDGNTLTASGVYTASHLSTSGCDSLVTLTLSVLPVSGSQREANICQGTTYPFYGLALSVSGTYTALLPGSNGCDSTVTLVLAVYPTYLSTLNATICANEPYPFNGQMLNTSGTYTAQLSTVAGCDSVIVLQLTVLPVNQSSLNITTCNGQPYLYNNIPLTQSDTYTFLFTGASGCDSVVTLHLTIVPAISPTMLSATICEGDFYDFDNQILGSPGLYSAAYTTADGCDSLVALTLTVTTVNTGIVLSGNTLTAAAGNATYQWMNCITQQPVNGATSATYTPAVTGSYAVQVTQNGCTAQSECVAVTVVSTQEAVLNIAWNIQPNPAVSEVFVTMTEPTSQTLFVSVLDITGRQIMIQQVGIGATIDQLDVAGLPEGIYLIKLSDSRGSAVKRLVKVRS